MTLLFLTNDMKTVQPLFTRLDLEEKHSNIIICDSPLDRYLSTTSYEPSEIDFIISYNYAYIINGSILTIFPEKIVNLHISFLPYNRGASPNLWSFMDNTPKGVTIHMIDSGVDTGNILIQEQLYFDEATETFSTTYQKLHLAIQRLFFDNWEKIKSGEIKPQRQVGNGSVHTKKQTRELMIKHGITWDSNILSTKQRMGIC